MNEDMRFLNLATGDTSLRLLFDLPASTFPPFLILSPDKFRLKTLAVLVIELLIV